MFYQPRECMHLLAIRWLVGSRHCRRMCMCFLLGIGHRPVNMCLHVVPLDTPTSTKPKGRKLSTVAPSAHGRLTDTEIACNLIDGHNVGKLVDIIHSSCSLHRGCLPQSEQARRFPRLAPPSDSRFQDTKRNHEPMCFTGLFLLRHVINLCFVALKRRLKSTPMIFLTYSVAY